MKAEILKMLREADGYISGQEICEKFNVSRTAVWKVIRRLQEDGYEVEAVRNKGKKWKAVCIRNGREEMSYVIK